MVATNMQVVRRAHLADVQKSMENLLAQISTLGDALEQNSKHILLQTLSSNMHSLNLVLDDSYSADALFVHLSSVLASNSQGQVWRRHVLVLMIELPVCKTVGHRHVNACQSVYLASMSDLQAKQLHYASQSNHMLELVKSMS
jgi:hypothetical protein